MEVRTIASLVVAICLLAPALTRAEDQKTGSRTPFVHLIPLRDTDGNLISMPPLMDNGTVQDAKGKPFSMAQTCSKCHEYSTINAGWHFNAAKGNVKPGRPGEPWILTDSATHTQIPLSYRGWAGTFKPGEIGMTDFDFVANFARHLPGGGVGDPEKIDEKDPNTRRLAVTGPLENDCLICHDATDRYIQEARFSALRSQAFKWAPTIAAGFGTLSGFKTPKAIADSWRTNNPAPTNLPAIKYDRARFDSENNVLLQLTRRSTVNACYFCHTVKTQFGDDGWHSDRDVHLRAGMLCVDCHRNSIDHMIVRGYEGEVKDRSVSPDMIEIRAKILRRDDATLTEDAAKTAATKQLNVELGLVETLSCKGCHYGAEEGKTVTAKLGGRMGAPKPIHRGLPPIHLEKLTCTACHSGPLPEAKEQIVQTSMAHKLGLPGAVRGKHTPPVIVEPVFLRDENGKIGPFKMVWPSYWGRLGKDGKVTPILPDDVTKAYRFPSQSHDEAERDPYLSKPLADSEIQTVLTKLAVKITNGEPVFIASGKMFKLENGALKSSESEIAKPYSWALAHDVRPARQAAGARGCADCHSADSPIYFGTIMARGPVQDTNGWNKAMWQLRGDDKAAASTFAFTFNFRPMLKVICLSAAFIVFAVIVFYGLAAIGGITSRTREKNK